MGEKGPEIVKLESGSNVVPNEKIVTADQKLSERIGPSEKQIEKYRKYLLNNSPDYYSEFPDELDYDVKDWIKSTRYQKESTIDSLLEGRGEETFTREDVAKLSSPVSPQSPSAPTADEELSKSEKRKKEREDRKSSKEKAKAEKKEQDLESKKESEKKPGKLGDLAKSSLEKLKENSGKIIEKGTKLGEDLISKKIKNPELKKAAESGLKEVKELLSKATDKSKNVSTVTPLKTPAPKPSESPEKKSETQSQEPKKVEPNKANTETSTSGSPGEKSENKKGSGPEKSSSPVETNMSKADIDEMKSALFRIASLLEGTLIVSPIESPYRPNSKRI